MVSKAGDGFMKKLWRCMRAEWVKMRHTFLYPLHLAAPVAGSALFLLYYRAAGHSGAAQIAGFIQVIGIALPFAVSIVCAGNVGREEQTRFLVFPGSTAGRWHAFLAKYLVLLALGAFAVSAAVFLFAAGYHGIFGKEGVSRVSCAGLSLVLWLGSAPLYLEHLFLNLAFEKQVSLCVGVAQFLLSALFLTGLGDGRWQLVPCTWSARGASLFLAGGFQNETAPVFAVCLLLWLFLCVIIGVWFYFYEGRQCND